MTRITNFVCILFVNLHHVFGFNKVSLADSRYINYTISVSQSSSTQSVSTSEEIDKIEERLHRYIFKNYNPNIMPKRHLNETLKLSIGLALIQIINIVFYFLYFASLSQNFINFIKITSTTRNNL